MMSITDFKKKIYEIITPSEDGNKASKVFDVFIIALVVVNVVMVMAYTFDVHVPFFHPIEFITVVIFSIEYILRLWTADALFPETSKGKARLKYIFSFMALVDLVAILPFYLPFVFSSYNLVVLRFYALSEFCVCSKLCATQMFLPHSVQFSRKKRGSLFLLRSLFFCS